MNHRKSQIEVVKSKLERDGQISNLWAFRNYILRLGALVFRLREEGWVLETSYKNVKGHRNCVYKVISKPKK